MGDAPFCLPCLWLCFEAELQAGETKKKDHSVLAVGNGTFKSVSYWALRLSEHRQNTGVFLILDMKVCFHTKSVANASTPVKSRGVYNQWTVCKRIEKCIILV